VRHDGTVSIQRHVFVIDWAVDGVLNACHAESAATEFIREGTMTTRITHYLTIILLASLVLARDAFADGNGKCSSAVNCDAAKTFCFAALDLDPINCGIYYGCCYGAPSLPIGDPDCRNQPCGPGCPSDLCIQSGQALTVGSPTIKTDLALGASAVGNLSVEVATDRQRRVLYNWWNLGQGAHGWSALDGRNTNAAPAAALVGRKYLFVVIKGVDGTLYLNQGDVTKPFIGWQPMGFQSALAPGAASSGNTTAVVAANKQGKLFYTWWTLGQGAQKWAELDGQRSTNVAPAAALVGNYLFVVMKGLDGSLYINQGALGKEFVGWQRMGFQTDVAPGAASAGNVSVVVATDKQGRIFYNWWAIGEGSRGWHELEGHGQTNAAPAAALVRNYLFVIIKGLDGNVYLNQGDLGKPFVGWQ